MNIKRITFVKIHLYFSGVALVFMALMSISGSLHLFLGNESDSVEVVKSFASKKDYTKQELSTLFTSQIAQIDPAFRYDYIKGSESSLTTRPTSRKFYTIKLKDGLVELQRHSPGLRKSLMELHKGHAAKASRPVLGVLGFLCLGAVLSGLWLGLSSKAFQKTTIITMFSGAIVYFLLFFL